MNQMAGVLALLTLKAMQGEAAQGHSPAAQLRRGRRPFDHAEQLPPLPGPRNQCTFQFLHPAAAGLQFVWQGREDLAIGGFQCFCDGQQFHLSSRQTRHAELHIAMPGEPHRLQRKGLRASPNHRGKRPSSKPIGSHARFTFASSHVISCHVQDTQPGFMLNLK